MLEIYNKKRNFAKTSEPSGKKEKQGKERVFVIQHHLARAEHYDLRLEHNGVLLSWAVPKGLSLLSKDKRLAVHVEDHPLSYRHFEGEIPKGQYGGGTVSIFDSGTYESLTDVDKGLKSGFIKFRLHGKKLKGVWTLLRTKEPNWLVIRYKEKNAKNPFTKTDVQLAKLADKLPSGDEWLFELKYDGYRALAYVEGGEAKVVSRNQKDMSLLFKNVAQALVELAGGKSMVLDGEIVAVDKEGKSNFNMLQNGAIVDVIYVVFDLLAYEGDDLRNIPLIKRKEKLTEIMKDAGDRIKLSEYVSGLKQEDLNNVCQNKFEGLIAKKKDSVYGGSRNGNWVKIKCENRQEFVIGGYTLSSSIAGISSLLLGFFEDKKFLYAGSVGTGFSEKQRIDFEKRLKLEIVKSSPFGNTPKLKDAIWVKPKLLAEVKFGEWTSSGVLRHASFLGLRNDKNTKDVVKEAATVSNGDKIVFKNPAITKQEVADYYQSVVLKMLPYIEGRYITIIRCPNGLSSCFYNRNKDATPKSYIQISSAKEVLEQVQLNALEFHTWGSRVDSIDSPDIMVFDLDPDEGMGIVRVRQGLRDLKQILKELNLTSYLKTSGGKGYHVVVPFKESQSWEVFRDFAKGVAELMEQKWSDRYTTNVRKAARKGKIFIDWIRNTKTSTSVAPYSLRAKEGAPVSMPIAWTQLDTIAPQDINIKNAVKRGKDPWADFFEVKQRQKLK